MKFTCPICKEEYDTTHDTKDEAFSTNNFTSIEQWLSHICSDKCFDSVFEQED